MKSSWSDVSQNDRNIALQFTQFIHDHFGQDFANYQVETNSFGHQMYFNNYLLVLRIENCLVRIVCDREDIYFEIAELSTPELYRKPLTPNLWFDVSVLVAYLENSERFSWFYDYSESPLDLSERLQGQLSFIAHKMRPYWSTVIDMFNKSEFQHQRDELLRCREKRAADSWKACGWNNSLSSEQHKNERSSFWSFINSNHGKSQKINKVVLGHFPEYVDKANEISATYFGIDAQSWVILQRDELRWAVTKRFLDISLNAKSIYLLATEVRYPESYFARELQYLVSRLKPA